MDPSVISSSTLPPRKESDASYGLTQEQTTLLYPPYPSLPSNYFPPPNALLSPSGTMYSGYHQPNPRLTSTAPSATVPAYLPYTTKSLIVSIISGNLAFILLCIILLHNYRMFIDADLFYPIFWALLVALVLFRPKTILVQTLQKSLSSPLTLWDSLLFLLWWPWNNAITTIQFTLKRFKLKEKWRKYIVPYLLPLLIRMEKYTPPFLSEIIRAVLWISRPSSSNGTLKPHPPVGTVQSVPPIATVSALTSYISSTTSMLSTASAASTTNTTDYPPQEYTETNPVLLSSSSLPTVPLTITQTILPPSVISRETSSSSSAATSFPTSARYLTSYPSSDGYITDSLVCSPRPYRQPTLSSVDSILSSDLDTSIDNMLDENDSTLTTNNNESTKINYGALSTLPTIPSHNNLEFISSSPVAGTNHTILPPSSPSPSLHGMNKPFPASSSLASPKKSNHPGNPSTTVNAKHSHKKPNHTHTSTAHDTKEGPKASPTMSVRTTGTTHTARTRETAVSWLSDATAETLTDPATDSLSVRKEDSFWSWAATPSGTNSVSHMSDFFWNALYLGYTLWFISLYPRTALSIFLFGLLYMIFIRIRLVLSKRKEVREKLRKYKQFIFQHLQLIINTYYTIDRYSWYSISRTCSFLWWFLKYIVTVGEEIIVYTVKKLSAILLAIVHPISAILIIIMVLLCGFASVLILSNLVLDEWREAVYDTRTGMVSLVETSSGLATLQNTTWFIPILTLTKYLSPTTVGSTVTSSHPNARYSSVIHRNAEKRTVHSTEWQTELYNRIPENYRHNYTNMTVPELWDILTNSSLSNSSTFNTTEILAYMTENDGTFTYPSMNGDASIVPSSPSSSLLPLSLLDTMNITEVIENGVNWLSSQWPNETEVIRNLWGLYKEYNSTVSSMNPSNSSSNYNDWYGYTYGYPNKVDNLSTSPNEGYTYTYRYLSSFTYDNNGTLCIRLTDETMTMNDTLTNSTDTLSSSGSTIPSYRCVTNETTEFVPSDATILTYGRERLTELSPSSYSGQSFVGNPVCEIPSFVGMVDSSTNQPLPAFTLFLHLLNQKGITILFKPSCYVSALEAIGVWSSTANSNGNHHTNPSSSSSSSLSSVPSLPPSAVLSSNGYSSSSSVNTIYSSSHSSNENTNDTALPWFSGFPFGNLTFSLYDLVADFSGIVGIGTVNPNANGTLTNTTNTSASAVPSFSSFLIFPSFDSVLRSSSAVLFFMGQSTSLLFSYALSASASVVAFLLSLVLFLNLLFYLLAAERDWLTMALEFLPHHEQGRVQTILSETISGVFIVNAKMALYHALFTFLVLRIMDVHFVYTITALSAICAVIPFFPTFLIAFPAAMELIIINGSSVQGTVFIILYSLILSYADWYVCERTSHVHPAVLGLSIIAGSVSFGSSQGALMGPLLVSSLVTAYKLVVEQFRSVATMNGQGNGSYTMVSSVSGGSSGSPDKLPSSPSNPSNGTGGGTVGKPLSNDDIDQNEQTMEYRKQQILYLQASTNGTTMVHDTNTAGTTTNSITRMLDHRTPSMVPFGTRNPSLHHPRSADIWNSPAGMVSERGIIPSPTVTENQNHSSGTKPSSYPLYSTQSGNLGTTDRTMMVRSTNETNYPPQYSALASMYRTPHPGMDTNGTTGQNSNGGGGGNSDEFHLHRLTWSNPYSEKNKHTYDSVRNHPTADKEGGDNDDSGTDDEGTFTVVNHHHHPKRPVTTTKKNTNVPLTDTKVRPMTSSKGNTGYMNRYTTINGSSTFTPAMYNNPSTGTPLPGTIDTSTNTPSARSEVATPTTVFARRDAGVRKFREQMSTRKR